MLKVNSTVLPGAIPEGMLSKTSWLLSGWMVAETKVGQVPVTQVNPAEYST
jgi:hypothetical protein